LGENVKKAMLTVLQIAAILALAMWLFRLAVCYLSKIWWVLLILAVIIAAGVFGWRWWKAHRGEY
jgi:hypothetical protein